MREMLFGFEGTMGRMEFFLGHILLFFVMIVLAVLLLVPLAVGGLDYTLQPGSAQPSLALFTFLLGVFFLWSSSAMISKRLGWKGGKGNVTWVYFLTASGGLIIGTVSTAIGAVSLYSLLFWVINLGAFFIACIIPGKVQGDDFDETALEVKVQAEMRERYSIPAQQTDSRQAQPVRTTRLPTAQPSSIRPVNSPTFGRR